MLWQCRCNELMSNLNFATLPMFELKVEWFTEEGQANWMDPLVDWMRATGMDPEGDPLMIKPASGYAGVGVQPVRGALAVGHAAMDLFATVSASSATQWTAQWRLIAPRWHPGDRLCCQGALFAPVSAKLPFPDARIVVCWHTTKAIAWLDGVMLADWGHAVLLLHFDWLQGCTTWPAQCSIGCFRVRYRAGFILGELPAPCCWGVHSSREQAALYAGSQQTSSCYLSWCLGCLCCNLPGVPGRLLLQLNTAVADTVPLQPATVPGLHVTGAATGSHWNMHRRDPIYQREAGQQPMGSAQHC